MKLKKQMFALELVKAGGDTAKAAEVFGIKNSTALTWSKQAPVIEYIAELNQDIEKVLKINKTVIVQKALDIHDSAIKGDMRYDKEGMGLDRKPDRAAANRALENVSTMMGYNSPKEVNVNVDLSTWLVEQQPDPIDVKVIEND